MMKTVLTGVVIYCILGYVVDLPAQTFRGGIQGTVTDITGHPAADAIITVINLETGLTRVVNTSSAGTYFMSELPIGSYDIKVEKNGVRPQLLHGIKVEVFSNQRVDFQLKPKDVVEEEKVTQVIEMSGQSPLIDATKDNLGGTLEASQILQFPMNGRRFEDAFPVIPGVATDPSRRTDSAGSFGSFSVNGNRGRSNSLLINGTNMTDSYRNLPTLPLDSVQEVSVVNSTEAEFGRSSGGTVDFVTKSGTNSVHGSAVEYFRNNALDARNFFNNVGIPQNVFQNNQFGGSVGGPIVKDKTFWFVAYEGQRERVGFPSLARVPTQAEINQSIAANGGTVNPVIANLLAHGLWPSANRTADSQGNNLITTNQAPELSNSVIAKVDHFRETDFLSGSYFYASSDRNAPLALAGGGDLPGFNTMTSSTLHVASVSYTHIFGLHLLTVVRGGYSRLENHDSAQDLSFDPNSVGLNTGVGPQDFGLPEISVANFATLGAASSDPRGRISTSTQFFNNYTYSSGRHNWRFGYEFRRSALDGFFDSGYRGSLRFATLDQFIAGTPSSGRQAQGDSSRQTFQNNHSLYFQDNFSVFSNFTVNYGLRWEYFGVIGEDRNRFSILDSEGNLQRVKQLYPRDLTNFAPRASLAWDIRGDAKSVLRAGWGVYYDAFSQDFFVGQIPFNTFNAGPAYNGVGTAPVTFSVVPATIIVSGVRVFAPSTFGARDVFTVNQNLRTPYIQSYNLNLERELMRNVALEVGYAGSAGRNLVRYVDLNQVNPATGTVAFPDLGVANEIQTSAASRYDALQSLLRFRDWHGLTLVLNYNWSHSIDNASDGIDFVPNASQPDNSFRPDLERASSNFDQRQRLSWAYSYHLPSFRTVRAITSGWEVNGILTISDGQPFNVDYLFEDDFNGSGESVGRPDLVGDASLGTIGSSQFLNLAAFKVPCTVNSNGQCIQGSKHFGNLGRNARVGPKYKNFDFSLAKTQPITERVKARVSIEISNFFNHPNFANPALPNHDVDFAQNGLDVGGHGKGFLPITVTPDVASGNPFLGGGGPRSIQMALRLSF